MLIGIVLGLMVVVSYIRNEWDGESIFTHFMSFVSTVIMGGIAFVVGIVIAFLIGLAVPTQYVHTGTANLASLRNPVGIQGSFFLGTGSIGSHEYYFFYTENGDGSLRPGKIAADDSVKIWEGKHKPRLDFYERKPVKDSWWVKLFTVGTSGGSKYEFYIPEGTLKRNFVLE